ncbi:MAG: DUF6231 family protein [Litorivicinus sp.]
MTPFEHWAEGVSQGDGQLACIGCELNGSRPGTPPPIRLGDAVSDWPAQYFKRCVVRIDVLDAKATAMLGRLRNQYAEQIALWIDRPSADDLEPLLGLGFKTLTGPPDAGCYGYDLDTYNHRRDWNNPKYWANPERWGKAFW